MRSAVEQNIIIGIAKQPAKIPAGARDPWCDRWAGGPPVIRAVPAPESLAAVLYDPSAPIKVGNMDDWYSLQDSACAVRQATRQLEQTHHQIIQLAKIIDASKASPPL